MHWQDLETLCPDGGTGLLSLLTHRTRLALGFPVQARDHVAELRVAYDAWARTGPAKWDHVTNGSYAVLAALDRDWDVVGHATGGPLPGRVVIKKVHGDNVRGLARHLAIVARGKLPGAHALAAIEDVRARFRAGGPPDPRSLVLASHLFVRDIVRAEDAIAATRAWLDGTTFQLDDARPVLAPADGEDPRVTIFERFAAELSEDAATRAELAAEAIGEPWARDVEFHRRTLDDLVTRACVARLPLPDRWAELVDPMVAAWLGTDVDGVGARYRDLQRLRPAGAIRGEWEDALWSLVAGAPEGFAALEQRKLKSFKPGQLFKDDARKLVRYLAAALAAGASADDVMPAWLDFLARRSPATTPRLAGERSRLRWKHLLQMQAAITERLARRPRGEVGRALQALVTGT